jgi:uncharacterized protein YigE (DUF2233 family)
MRFGTLLFSLFACLTAHTVAAPQRVVIDGIAYQILRATPASVRILWKDKYGTQLSTFPAVARAVQAEGETVDTVMNGGIFELGGVPSGLLVQDGKELRPVNRNHGDGNFFLKPNGILLIGSKGAEIVATEEYPPERVAVQYALQSGPLLLRHGVIHPRFSVDSASRLHRNGVGISKAGEVVLAITATDSARLPNLYEFAQLFLSLGCEDALFLDGVISQMRSGADLTTSSNNFGSIIVVTTTNSPQSGDASADQAPSGRNGSLP